MKIEPNAPFLSRYPQTYTLEDHREVIMNPLSSPAESTFWLILAFFAFAAVGITLWVAGTIIRCFVYDLPKEWVKSTLVPWLKWKGYWPSRAPRIKVVKDPQRKWAYATAALLSVAFLLTYRVVDWKAWIIFALPWSGLFYWGVIIQNREYDKMDQIAEG
jgi:hypothetical protein